MSKDKKSFIFATHYFPLDPRGGSSNSVVLHLNGVLLIFIRPNLNLFFFLINFFHG